jgi:adenylate cyclase
MSSPGHVDKEPHVARGALENLAENGGPDEGADIPLIGCNSRRAAQDALRRLP